MRSIVPCFCWSFVLSLGLGLFEPNYDFAGELLSASLAILGAIMLVRGATPSSWASLYALLGVAAGLSAAATTVRTDEAMVHALELSDRGSGDMIVADVLESPRMNVRGCTVRLHVAAIRRDDEWTEVGLPMRGTLVYCDAVEEGDRFVTLAAPHFSDPLDAPAWRSERARGSFGWVQIQHEVLLVGRALTGWGGIDELRRTVELRVREGTDTEVSGILLAMLTGSKGELSADRRWQFAVTGTAHVLAVSGLHLSLLVLGVWGTLRRLIRLVPTMARRLPADRWAAFIVLPLIVGYVVFTGAPSSARRAGAMAVVSMCGTLLGRPSSSWHALSVAVALVAADDPWQVTGVGYQLSVSATAGLVLHARCASSASGWLQTLWSGVRASIVASLATAPVLAWHFGEIPMLGPIANLLMVPPLTLVALPAVALGALMPDGSALADWLLLAAEMAVRLTIIIADSCDGWLSLRWVVGRPLGHVWWGWVAIAFVSPWFATRRWRPWVVITALSVGSIVAVAGRDQPDARVESVSIRGAAWFVVSGEQGAIVLTDGRGQPDSVSRRVGGALRLGGHGCVTVVLRGQAGRGLDGLWDQTCVRELIVTPNAYDGRWSLRAIRQAQARDVPVVLLDSAGVDAAGWHVACSGEECRGVDVVGRVSLSLWAPPEDVSGAHLIIGDSAAWSELDYAEHAGIPWESVRVADSWAREFDVDSACGVRIVPASTWNP